MKDSFGFDVVPAIARNKKASALLKTSRDLFESLDRSSLGSFAQDLDILIALNAIDMFESVEDIQLGPNMETAWLLLELANVRADELDVSPFSEKSYYKYWSEIMLWWSLALPDDEALAKFAEARMKRVPELAQEYRKIQKVYKFPVNRPFYEVDLWDDFFIAECLRAGVDAELAKSAYASGDYSWRVEPDRSL